MRQRVKVILQVGRGERGDNSVMKNFFKIVSNFCVATATPISIQEGDWSVGRFIHAGGYPEAFSSGLWVEVSGQGGLVGAKAS
jgi:hypothetical protein